MNRFLRPLALITAAMLLLPAAALAQKPELRVGVEGIVAIIDPGRDHSNIGAQYTIALFEQLIHRDHTQVEAVLQPGLATEWYYVDDEETVLELKLREDAVFHNGEPVTAEDAAFSIQRIIDAEYVPYVNIRGQYFQNLAGTEVVDDYTVRVIVHLADPLLELLLSMSQLSIIPKAYAEEVGFEAFGQFPIGSGPYKLTEFVPRERIVLAEHTESWREPVNASAVTLRAIPELSSRVTALVNNEVDIIDDVAPDQIPVLERAGHEVIGNVAPIFHIVYYNAADTNHEIMQDKLLRQALNLSIDRELLVQALWNNEAVVPLGHQFENFGDMYIEDLGYEPFDPELARERLSQSSYNGETLVLRAADNYYTNELLAVQAIKEMWEAIGVNVELAIEAVLDQQEFMIRTWSNPMYFPDPVGTWGAMWNPGGYRVPSDWDPEAEDYLEAWETLRFSEDLEVRREAFRRLQEISRDEVPYSILYQPIEYYGVRAGVNWQPLPGHQAYALDFNAYNLSFE